MQWRKAPPESRPPFFRSFRPRVGPEHEAVALRDCEAWRRVLPVFEASESELPAGRLAPAALEALHQLATEVGAGFVMHVMMAASGPATVGYAPEADAGPMWWVLKDLGELIQSGGLARLRHCPVCRRWFVDMTKSRTQQRCSPRCTNRSWNRAQRRAAEHDQYVLAAYIRAFKTLGWKGPFRKGGNQCMKSGRRTVYLPAKDARFHLKRLLREAGISEGQWAAVYIPPRRLPAKPQSG